MFKQKWLLIPITLALLVASFGPGGAALAQGSRAFPETGKTVSGRFLQYWSNNGGLTQQGYPISDEMDEQSETDGNTYTVQYFERAVFEKHPENAAPNDVLLTLLGNFLYKEKYPDGAPGQTPSSQNPRKFGETGKTLGGKFRAYWESHGGLAQQGFPISEEFQEVSETDGKTYTVQYFERAVFEYHPEYEGTQNEVLLSLLGKFRLGRSSGGGGGKATPTPDAVTANLAVRGWTNVVVATNNVAFFYNASSRAASTARVNSDGSLTMLADSATLGEYRLWTLIVAGPGNTLFFYNRSDGATSLSKVGDDGSVTVLFNYRPFSPIWSTIAIDTATSTMLFYSDTDGTQGLARLDLSSGEVITLKPYPGTLKPSDFRTSQFVPIKNGIWFFYVAGNGNGFTSSFTPTGDYAPLKSYSGFDRTWSQIVSNGRHLLFYDKTNAKAMTATIGDDGSFNKLKTYEGLSTEWTHFAAAPNGAFLIYSSETGNIATDQISAAGEELALKRYSLKK